MGSDQLFKVILRGLLREFLELFFPDFAARLDFGSMRFPDRELFRGFPDGSPREPDVVAEVQSLAGDREIVVVHVEVQTEAEEDFKRRMFEYYSLLWLHFDAPVFPIALILRRGPREGISTVQYRRNVFGREVVRFQFAFVSHWRGSRVGSILRRARWRRGLQRSCGGVALRWIWTFGPACCNVY